MSSSPPPEDAPPDEDDFFEDVEDPFAPTPVPSLPAAPTAPKVEAWWREVVTLVTRLDLDALSSAVAFNAVFSMGPLLSLSLTLMVAFDAAATREAMQRLIVLYTPQATHPFFTSLTLTVVARKHPLVALASFVVLLWTSSSVGSSLLSMVAHVRGIPRRHFVHNRIRAIVLGTMSAMCLGLLAVVVAFGPRVAGLVQTLLGYRFPALFALSALWVRVPFAIATFTAMAMMYFRHGTLPHVDRDISWRGGITTGLLVGVASALLSIWLSLAPRFGGGYGASTAFFGVLLWLYAIGVSFVLGACVVRVFERRRAEESPPTVASN